MNAAGIVFVLWTEEHIVGIRRTGFCAFHHAEGCVCNLLSSYWQIWIYLSQTICNNSVKERGVKVPLIKNQKTHKYHANIYYCTVAQKSGLSY